MFKLIKYKIWSFWNYTILKKKRPTMVETLEALVPLIIGIAISNEITEAFKDIKIEDKKNIKWEKE
jgi:hypothetical protein